MTDTLIEKLIELQDSVPFGYTKEQEHAHERAIIDAIKLVRTCKEDLQVSSLNTSEIDETVFHNACADMGIDKGNPNYRMFLEYYLQHQTKVSREDSGVPKAEAATVSVDSIAQGNSKGDEDMQILTKYMVGYICRGCAKSANCAWPDGHVATAHHGICDYCKDIADVCATSDWNWPNKKMRPEEREF